MAGRKPSPKQDLFSMLLGKIGLVQPKKGKKKRRKGPAKPRPSELHPEAPAFGDYAQESAMGFGEPAMDYEAAAAAGYAPPPAPAMEPLFPEAPAPVAPRFEPALPAYEPTPGKLFNEAALDNSLDELFAGLEAGAAPTPAAPAAELPFQAPPEPPKKPGTGTIVSFPTPQPAPAPPAPLLEPEPVAAAVTPPPPAPRTPSRPLMPEPAPLEPPAAGPAIPAEVFTLSQGQDLRTLLATIDRAPSVTGSLLVGYDGLIIASTLAPAVDREYLAAQACAMFTTANQQMQRLERGEMRRMVLETSSGAMLMTAADMGILVVVSDGQALDTRAVSAAIAGALGQG